MKCLAGVEFPNGKPCPKCKATLGDVCWPGINAELLELARLRKGIQDYLDGNYENPRAHRRDGPHETCAHGQFYWQPCESCVDAHFKSLLPPAVPAPIENKGGGQS